MGNEPHLGPGEVFAATWADLQKLEQILSKPTAPRWLVLVGAPVAPSLVFQSAHLLAGSQVTRLALVGAGTDLVTLRIGELLVASFGSREAALAWLNQ